MADPTPTLAAAAPIAVPAATFARIVNLGCAAEYISALAETTQNEIDRVRDAMRVNGLTGATWAESDDWRLVESLLNLAIEQAALVAQIAEEADTSRLRQAA